MSGPIVSRRALLQASAAGAVASGKERDVPDLAALGRWLLSWTQPSGAIHGFHNHSVWGDNPLRYADFTSGHSTFASPLISALSIAYRKSPERSALNLIGDLIRYQLRERQPDGQFAHIGFQAGETLKHGLIHNVVPCVSLSEAALHLDADLASPVRTGIDAAVRGVLAACDRRYGPAVTSRGVANQEYCRVWARLAHMEAFHHDEWDLNVRRDLDTLIREFHVSGYPDAGCTAAWRVPSIRDYVEPAEYYGLMIPPLLIAARRYRVERYLEAAVAMGRHIARSSWVDRNGQRRLHRLWCLAGGKWRRVREPMLIGGMGFTVSAVAELAEARSDPEFAAFVSDMDQTYAHYQNPAGFFLAASGWGAEQDIIPATAWQSHDLRHLILRHGVSPGFWQDLLGGFSGTAVVLGPSLVWTETGTHWSVRGYETQNGLDLAGRKDQARFGIDIPSWMRSGREIPADWRMPAEPRFVSADEAVFQASGTSPVSLLNASGRTFQR